MDKNSLNEKADLDAMAREQGFKDYAQMRQWYAAKRQGQVQPASTPTPAPTATPTPQPQQSSGIGALFDYIARVMGGGQ